MTLSAVREDKAKHLRPGSAVSVSAIIPVRNGAHFLRRTLPVLRDSLPPGWEIIVVDDNSTDGSREVALIHADKVIGNPDLKSAPAARNLGAKSAEGRILVFLDADIRVTRKSLTELVRALERPRVACTFAVYSEGRYLTTLGGRFKNIWVRYSYLKSPARVRWMNTAMAAIRKDDFFLVGLFGGQDDWLEGGNDMEFGLRVDRRIGPVHLLHDVDCDHLKEMSLGALFRNDFHRTRGFFRTALLSREIGRAPGQGYGNISPAFIGGVLAAGAIPLFLLLSPASIGFLYVAGAALLVHGLLSLPFYAYAVPRLSLKGWTVPPILLGVHLACAAGLVVEGISLLLARPERRPVSTALPEQAPAATNVSSVSSVS